MNEKANDLIEIYVTLLLTLIGMKTFQILINALQGRESSSIKSTAKQLTPEQRTAKLSTLRSQRQSWRESTAEYRMSQKAYHIKLLQEGKRISTYFCSGRK